MQADTVNIQKFQDEHRLQLLSVWERSVLATHHFLSREDFAAIKSMVAGIDFHLLEVFTLLQDDQLVGFIGVADKKVEMLFIDPNHTGSGLGKKLIQFAITGLQADEVDVNEQNHNAVAFYKKMGFEVYDRTEKDGQGKDYPILKMRLKK